MNDSKPAIDALWLLRRLVEDFPGLLDGETDTDCSGVVEEITYQLGELDALRAYLTKGNINA
jgi:hypothetical protein